MKNELESAEEQKRALLVRLEEVKKSKEVQIMEESRLDEKEMKARQ